MRIFRWMLGCVLLSFLLFAYPLYVIRPFRHQGPRELASGLVMIRFRPAVEIAAAVFALWLIFRLWRTGSGVWTRFAACVCAVLTIGFAARSRINVYEQMFHPVDKPAFAPASESKLDGTEQVIAVRIGTAARAYPIRSMSYHHVVNDTVAGIPLVATY
jgi:Protein of unknown function (DUF3179)